MTADLLSLLAKMGIKPTTRPFYVPMSNDYEAFIAEVEKAMGENGPQNVFTDLTKRYTFVDTHDYSRGWPQ